MALLDSIKDPADLKELGAAELLQLAAELRAEIVSVCSRVGGHLASSLGAVELTVALHHVFDSPRDRIIWDVGHQSYGHKILTGRRERLPSIRQDGGLSGFVKRGESAHDHLTVGHASTSLAAALGIALARDRRGDDHKVVAVIGDGALTGGMALAALNNIAHRKTDMLIVLNDNEMSISENVGALKQYLSSLRANRWVSGLEEDAEVVLNRMWRPLGWLFDRSKRAVKAFLKEEGLFTNWGVKYVGPVDGHDVNRLVYLFKHLKHHRGPVLLHTITVKGKGLEFAERDPIFWHGSPRFDPVTGEYSVKKGYTWSNALGDAICELADRDDRVYVITPAMREGSGLVEYSRRHRQRYLDTGICEDVAVTVGAGLALKDERPVVAIYSTFLQRAYDQVIHDVCLENLPVVFAIDRAGLVGGDGATHQGAYDVAYLRCLPNIHLAAPRNARELRAMLAYAIRRDGPTAIRFPRASVEPVPAGEWPAIEWGRWERLEQGTRAAILAYGSTVGPALAAARELGGGIEVVNARFLKPLDENMLLDLARRHHFILTVEDAAVTGSLGTAVAETLARRGEVAPRLIALGLPDAFIEHGETATQHRLAGIDAQAIVRALEAAGIERVTAVTTRSA